MLSDAHFMDIAYIIGSAGTCSRLQVGAVLVKERRIVSTGYNGAPAGMPHCDHSDPDDLRFTAITGGCQVAVHAEANAIAFAAKYGLSSKSSSMYVTNSPCRKCAELIINAGIIEVVYDQAYRLTDGLDLLNEARVHTVQVNRSIVRPMSDRGGDEPGLHSSKPSDPAFEEGWTAAAAARNRGSTGIPGGENR